MATKRKNSPSCSKLLEISDSDDESSLIYKKVKTEDENATSNFDVKDEDVEELEKQWSLGSEEHDDNGDDDDDEDGDHEIEEDLEEIEEPSDIEMEEVEESPDDNNEPQATDEFLETDESEEPDESEDESVDPPCSETRRGHRRRTSSLLADIEKENLTPEDKDFYRGVDGRYPKPDYLRAMGSILEIREEIESLQGVLFPEGGVGLARLLIDDLDGVLFRINDLRGEMERIYLKEKEILCRRWKAEQKSEKTARKEQ
ncbi:hypothetical protein AA313_de0207894 [Arthrobotrys entomopaga]|nr:hypothetical protein AA313_de0207894 [Arthrobotrys entomopaga]